MIKYLTQKQVSEILNVKISTLNHHRCTRNKNFDMPYVKVGRVILFPEEKFYEWLQGKLLLQKKLKQENHSGLNQVVRLFRATFSFYKKQYQQVII